ncbi:MAG: hypothetical protein ABWW69_01125 [Pyrodictiaceae archaeon]
MRSRGNPMLRWIGWGYLALALSMSILLFLPVQAIVTATSSLSMRGIGFAYLLLLVLGGLFLVGLLAVASMILRAVGWFGLCRRRSKIACIAFADVAVIQPAALVSLTVGLATLNSNSSVSIAALWLSVLAELTAIARLYTSTRYFAPMLLVVVGYGGIGIAAIASSVSKSILTGMLGHLAASSIAVLVLGVAATILILHPEPSMIEPGRGEVVASGQ